FVPSSPYVCPQVAQTKDQSLMPEYHLWGPRDYYKSSFYTENKAHFIGEIGYHGCPNVSSIERFIEPEYVWPYQDNPQWIVHAADPLPQGGAYKYRVKLMADQIGELFGFVPDNIEEFALASQICQAEAKKFFIEMTRLRKWRRTGIIWWNLIDCWPQFSDAVVDYYLGKKLAYWYIKRVQNPVCLMMDEPESWHCRVIMGNDSLEPAEGTYRVRDLTKGTLLEGDYYVAPNENACVGEVRVSRGEHRLFLLEWTVGDKHYGNHYTLGTPPFSFEEYRNWIQAIASLPNGFDPKAVAR
ncbi:MAG: glycoside hydrolase family 2, partial [Limnochordia bacterium]|nr:glycoside hydrolase family 2 [Limnochordia bacterium]